MQVPNIKELLRKLSFLRNNLSLLVPILIAVVAVVLFVPTRMISARLRKNIETESVNKGRRIETLLEAAVPTEAIKQVEEYQKAYANDANQIELLAKQTTQRELLSYKIFPAPQGSSILIFEEFARLYRKGIENMISDMGGGDRPTDMELRAALENASTRSRFGTGPYSQASPIPGSGPGRTGLSYGMLGDMDRKIVDEICRERARIAKVYVAATDLAGYDFWAGYKSDTGLDQAVKDCWYWQVGYWIVEDVATTIERINGGSNSVFTSPVKRLLSVNFDLNRKGAIRTRRPGTTRAKREGGMCAYVVSARDALTKPCTGRFSKDETGIDVVHFNVVVIVSAKAVLPFMEELCSAKQHKFRGFTGQDMEQTFRHNQMAILESNMLAIERDNRAHDMYRYGDDAVVELDLICEYMFNRTGYDEIKPEAVKQDILAAAETQTKRR